MSRGTIGLPPGLHQYLLEVSSRETDVQRRLREETARLPQAAMQIGPEQGQFMAFLVETIRATRILEIGTFTGYSALAMASAMPPQGKLLALDVSAEWTAIARRYWEEAGLSERIELRLGPALETLATVRGPFDLAFIDADKENIQTYYERCLELLRPGGLVLVDNVLWGGSVADPAANDPDTAALKDFNRRLRGDQRVALSMLPLGDGLTLLRKR